MPLGLSVEYRPFDIGAIRRRDTDASDQAGVRATIEDGLPKRLAAILLAMRLRASSIVMPSRNTGTTYDHGAIGLT